MSDSPAPRSGDPLTSEAVRRIARLARLRLSEERIERFRGELAAVLEHITRLESLDVSAVKPMAHPLDLINRLDPDVPRPPLSTADLLRNAPAVEGPYLAVPKVLDGEGS